MKRNITFEEFLEKPGNLLDTSCYADFGKVSVKSQAKYMKVSVMYYKHDKPALVFASREYPFKSSDKKGRELFMKKAYEIYTRFNEKADDVFTAYFCAGAELLHHLSLEEMLNIPAGLAR